jgi:Zn-finger nucleic acid-binding protein
LTKPPQMSLPPEAILHCPRCSETELQFGQDSGIGVRRCPKCRGQWFQAATFDYLVKETAKASQKIGIQMLSALGTIQRKPAVDTASLIVCPRCLETLHRRLYAPTADVLVDECTKHGVWLDDGELAKILNYVAKVSHQQAGDLVQTANEKSEHREV